MDKTEVESRSLGFSALVGFGVRVDERVTLDIEVSGWTGVADRSFGVEMRRTQLGLHGAAYVYPSRQGRFFVKGAVGLAAVVVDTVGGRTEGTGTGLGYVIGMGYDMPVWGETVIGPYMEVAFLRRYRHGVPNVIHLGLSLGRR